ncbi:M1 family metallopeptidase [Chryseobacterium koreense]|uniref:Aminopeptidase N n=1 Tax=Chryseobacterium koreense CCUG 49689 TaxID=1304281 RepID=A0A0J7J2G8_9FLAO|nr:M1 family metallopeptidase [Chryseobacterium koreense]KMQ72472.1 peptidase M1 [Chryseobacterium koreense CCUG 49689]MBB5333436.1 aminopeptidase N [Chryseobacterium koreense]
MKKILISALLLGVIFSSQTAFAQTDTSGRTEIYRATHTKTTELKHTKLKVNFDYQKEQMNGEAWISASPHFYPSDSLVLDAKAMLIHEVALDKNGSKSPLKYDYKNDMLKINLDKTYSRNQDYTVYIKYTARPNEVKQVGSAAITDAKGLYFINPQGKESGKPTQIWTQGETESNSVWFPTIDKPNQKTTQEIYMTVPDKYLTLSNGVLKDSKKEGNNLRTDHWVMDKKHAPYLFFMGVGEYAVVKDKWRNIPVDYYVEKEYEPYAKQIFGNTPEMIEFFSKRLNYDYPWPKYSQITGVDYVSGAMENTTSTLHSTMAQQKPGDLIDENRWEDVISHELFHHWFGDLVTAESWSNITVNESFANYSEYLWNEYKYGKDFADYTLMKTREGYFRDPSNVSKDLVRFNYHSREDVFDGVSYNKGGSILHMLRNYLGDDAFFAGLTDYLKTNEYGTGEAQQLRLSLEKISGKDLNWFFNQWYYGNGNPKLSYTSTFDPVKKMVTVSIIQNQGQYFQFPLAIDVYENGKPTRQNVWVAAKSKNDFSFSITKSPDLLNIDADGVLLSEITDNKTPEQYFMQYTNSKEFLSRYKAVENAADNASKNAVSVKTLVAALKDSNFRIRIKALSGLDLSKPDQQKAALAEVEKMAVNDPKTLVQSAAITALAKTKDKKYLPVFDKGMSAVSNAVKGASLGAIAVIDPSRVSALANQIDLDGASDDLIAQLLPIIVKNKIEKQMPAIAQTAAFYPFIKFQNPELGASAEEAFNWIMGSDNLKATENLTKVLTQVKSQIGQNPQAKMMIVQILKEGLAKKMQVLKANPSSPTINAQIDAINKAIEAYK